MHPRANVGSWQKAVRHCEREMPVGKPPGEGGPGRPRQSVSLPQVVPFLLRLFEAPRRPRLSSTGNQEAHGSPGPLVPFAWEHHMSAWEMQGNEISFSEHAGSSFPPVPQGPSPRRRRTPRRSSQSRQTSPAGRGKRGISCPAALPPPLLSQNRLLKDMQRSPGDGDLHAAHSSEAANNKFTPRKGEQVGEDTSADGGLAMR